VPLRERNAGSGFQIALEGDGATLIWKVNHNVNRPGTILGRVNAVALVVLGTSS
jgi:hypothetical protein